MDDLHKLRKLLWEILEREKINSEKGRDNSEKECAPARVEYFKGCIDAVEVISSSISQLIPPPPKKVRKIFGIGGDGTFLAEEGTASVYYSFGGRDATEFADFLKRHNAEITLEVSE